MLPRTASTRDTRARVRAHGRTCVTLLGLAAALATTAWGQSSGRPLVVGTKAAEPFVIRDADGSWRGISIELWQRLATDLGLTYEIRERPLQELISGAADGTLDVAVAAITATAEREERVDFSHPFYSTGLGIAVRSQPAGGWVLVRRVFSGAFVGAIALLTAVLLAVGVVVWLLERRGNPSQFGALPCGASARASGGRP